MSLSQAPQDTSDQAIAHAKDLKAIADPQASEDELRGAILRLSVPADPQAREAAHRLKAHPAAKVREAVAYALGHYMDPQSLEALRALTRDQTESVRVQAISGFSEGQLTSQDRGLRVQELQKVAARAEPPLSDAENVAIPGALLKLDPSDLTAQKALLGLTKRYSGELQALAMVPLLLHAASNSDVVKRAHELFNDKTEPELLATEIRILSARRDPWLQTRISVLMEHPSESVQRAVLGSLHLACPEDRWTLIESALGGSQRIFEAALEALRSVPGSKSRETAEKALKETQDPARQHSLKELLDQLGSAQEHDICLES